MAGSRVDGVVEGEGIGGDVTGGGTGGGGTGGGGGVGLASDLRRRSIACARFLIRISWIANQRWG